jgi:hypothetical protein
MPFRYQCIECDAIFYAKTPPLLGLCDKCRKAEKETNEAALVGIHPQDRS